MGGNLFFREYHMKPNRSRVLLMAVVCLSMGLAATALAQPPQPGGGPPGPGGPGFGGPGGPGGFFGGGGLIGLLARDEVQQELQLVDEQKDKVRTLTEDLRNKAGSQLRDVFTQMRDLSDEERRAKFGEIRAKIEEINADAEKQLAKELLPHQLERLKQIDLQTKIRYRGADALTSGDIAKTLNLTDEQRDKLEKRAAEVQQELQTQIRQLQADARKKMLDVLTPDQRAQLDKLMGQQFDLPEQNFGDRFRGRRGNRGTDRPGQRPEQKNAEAI
jgi:Spy/CpxP family protein refolding chaperone